MTSVVYPYIHSKDFGHELKCSIRSVQKYADFDFDIWVIGEKPAWYKGNHIPFPKNESRVFDIARKLKIILETSAISDDFVYMYDDVYFLQKTSLKRLKTVIAKEPKGVRIQGAASRGWKMLLESTYESLGSIEKLWNYETHLPRLLNKERLRVIYESYNLRVSSLLFNTLYFNEYFDKPDIVLSEKNDIKLGLYSPYNFERIKEMQKGKWYLNHDDNGYTQGCKKFITEINEKKSKFET